MDVSWKFLNFAFFAWTTWLSQNSASFSSDPPKVDIKNGTLQGTFMTSKGGRGVAAFRGIPYAQPPLNKLRFQPPEPSDPWSGIRLATEFSNVCIQRDVFTHQADVVGVEDCLYLNVYSPKLPTSQDNRKSELWPVMVSVHGGGFISGTSMSAAYSPKFLLDKDVVLVTFNYRLGPLGFLSTEDLIAPGNQGMKDQVQALRWVRENIAAFGGDPDNVTIFGESAGGVSVHYHLISPLSRGLFHRGISQSGTAMCPWSLARPGLAKKNAEKLARLLNCPTSPSKNLIDCLRLKSPEDIIATDRAFQVFDYDPMVSFRLVIEPDHFGAFINEEPAKSLKTGNVADVPWMTGITRNEGALKVAGIYGLVDEGYLELLNEKFMELAPMSLLYEDTCLEIQKDNITRSIRKFYLNNSIIDETLRMNLVDMYTDAWFYIAADESVRHHLKTFRAPIYYYNFNYRGSLSLSFIYGDSVRDYGIVHGDDLQYVFPVSDTLGVQLTEQDYEMVDLMTGFLVNFATTGNPTPRKDSKTSAKWSPVRSMALEYLDIGGPNQLKMASNLHSDRVQFWNSIPYKAKVDVSTTMRNISRKPMSCPCYHPLSLYSRMVCSLATKYSCIDGSLQSAIYNYARCSIERPSIPTINHSDG